MKHSWLRLLTIGALLLPQLVHAQYSWIDDKGVRVFSDRPPPPGTPAARILKSPRGMAVEPLPAPDAAATPAEASPAPGSPAWKLREAEYRDRMSKAKKEEREAEVLRQREKDAECTWARTAQQQLDTPRRLEWKNQKGELEYISDKDRAREQAKVKGILANCG
jgi:hypothetical protein